MHKLKENWEITQNWQLIYIILGIIGLLACGYFIAIRLLPSQFDNIMYEYIFTGVTTIILAYIFYKITMWLFKKLRSRWNVQYRWELITIFIVFAITGSLSARLSGPFLEVLGINQESISAWLFWPLRLLLIFPIYQIVLVCMGWIFGQFHFFWEFEKKMLSRFGIKL